MSSASGIKVSPEVTDAWSTACQTGLDKPVRAIVLHIDGDSFNLKESITSSGTYKEDISALPRDSKTCSTYIYRTDTKSGGNWQWILITFVPDNAGVRSKMLHASSKAGLLKVLGEGRFRHNMFFTSSDDLTPSAFAAHLDHLDAPPPMSETEKALAQIKISEAEEASARVARLFGGDAKSQDHFPPGNGLWSNALKPTGNAMTAVSGLAGPAKGTLKWGSGVEQALAQLKSGHSDGMAVFLHIEPKSETLVLADSVGEQPLVLSPAKLSSKLPPKEPCYTFYAWPSALAAPQPTTRPEETPPAQREPSDTEDLDSAPTSAAIGSSQPSNITMIYTCPSASPVRYRMIYSSSLRGVMKEASTLIGLTIDRKLETSDIADLTESYLRSEIIPSVEQHVSTNRYRSNIKSASTDDAGRRSPIVRQPVRSATAISQAQSAQASPATGGSVTPQYGSEQSTRGELPESAFSMFGPRVNLSPGGGAGFARPRPAGRR